MTANAPKSSGAAEGGSGSLLTLGNLSKSFGGARALHKVDLDVAPGEVHGLLGTNGSGKSTLVKVLSGFYAPDPGASMTLKGRPVTLPLRAGEFRRLGLAFVHQNLGLIESLSVLENLRISAVLQASPFRIGWAAQRLAARQALAQAGLEFDLDQPVSALSPADRALLAILRASEDLKESQSGGGVLLLDEPTPFLPAADVGRLFDLVRRIVDQGSSVIFISHDIGEVMEITDRITVLRDGQVAGRLRTRDAGHDEVVRLIIGRKLEPTPHRRSPPAVAPAPLLRLRDVSGGSVRAMDLEVAAGEILGLTGLIGSGYADVCNLVFGASRARSGRMDFAEAHDIELSGETPRQALDRGMALLPADRPRAGGVGALSIADNMMLPSLARFFRGGVLQRRRIRERAREFGAVFEVRPNDPDLPLAALSGGNAQKVLIARWMSRSPRLLLLDEPTQGVDVGTRRQIFTTLLEASAEGMAVICASSDYEQLAEICERVVVFRAGRIRQVLTGAAITKAAIAEACYAGSGGGSQT